MGRKVPIRTATKADPVKQRRENSSKLDIFEYLSSTAYFILNLFEQSVSHPAISIIRYHLWWSTMTDLDQKVDHLANAMWAN